MTPWARLASFQKSGASASRSSALSLAFAWSGSKMPPKQRQGFLDVVDDRLGFSAHRVLVLVAVGALDQRLRAGNPAEALDVETKA